MGAELSEGESFSNKNGEKSSTLTKKNSNPSSSHLEDEHSGLGYLNG